MSDGFQVTGSNPSALFTLKIHRGDGMSLVAMNWKSGKPPDNFVGFAIEYKEPGGEKFFALKNRLTFPGTVKADPNAFSTLRSPIQKFRWVHFPRNASLNGDFTYRVSPLFMNDKGELSVGDPQEAKIELRRETYPGQLNIAHTRGFVSSQAFVDQFKTVKGMLPAKANVGLKFVATHAQAAQALPWMGFEAREAILDVLDQAIADAGAQVRCVGYDLNIPDIVSRLEKLGPRLKMIIDDSGEHGVKGSAENDAEKRLVTSAGRANVQRQKMGNLQHNKFIAVDGAKVQLALCGSTNFSWRAFYVQNNNALVLQGKTAVKLFFDAFDNYSKNTSGSPSTDVSGFASSPSVKWSSLGLADN
jgi:hypothetical protein